jgi:hypothetical protein
MAAAGDSTCDVPRPNPIPRFGFTGGVMISRMASNSTPIC